MRGDAEPREWLRWSELWAWVQAEFPALGTYDVRLAVRQAGRPERRYGHFRYERRHMDAVRAYAARMGVTKETRHV
jgi:hypothetical protein